MLLSYLKTLKNGCLFTISFSKNLKNTKLPVKQDIVEVLDALCDIAYVSIGNGAMLHGLKDKLWDAYQEVQASNMSKACASSSSTQAFDIFEAWTS